MVLKIDYIQGNNIVGLSVLVHPVNEYASTQHMVAGLKVEAVFS